MEDGNKIFNNKFISSHDFDDAYYLRSLVPLYPGANIDVESKTVTVSSKAIMKHPKQMAIFITLEDIRNHGWRVCYEEDLDYKEEEG